MSAPTKTQNWTVAVGLGSCGIAAGAQEIFDHARARLAGTPVRLIKTGCAGLCYLEPMLELYAPDGARFTYIQVNPSLFDNIIEKHIGRGEPLQENLLFTPGCKDDAGLFMGKQKAAGL